MQAVNPLLYISDISPIPESVVNASGWFETETMTIEWQEGKETDMTNWFIAQGWVVEQRLRLPNKTSSDPEAQEETTYTVNVAMKRRKMQSERVLQSMLSEFTAAYNEGRDVNDRRYENIVTLYDIMLSRSEYELSAVESAGSGYESLIDAVIVSLPADWAAHDTEERALVAAYGVSQRARINLLFDNELAKAGQSLVSRGLYNSTVWTTTSSGIERNRTQALNDFEDKIIERQLASLDRLARLKNEMRSKLESASHRMLEQRRSKAFTATELRNRVLGAMLSFMERRTDEYPGLNNLSELAAKLGYNEGGTVYSPAQ
jgi:hypothetical protein